MIPASEIYAGLQHFADGSKLDNGVGAPGAFVSNLVTAIYNIADTMHRSRELAAQIMADQLLFEGRRLMSAYIGTDDVHQRNRSIRFRIDDIRKLLKAPVFLEAEKKELAAVMERCIF